MSLGPLPARSASRIRRRGGLVQGPRGDLAKDFVARIRAVVKRISATPKMHAAVHGDVRKAVVSRFPYIVLYRKDAGELIVITVFHTSRDPAEWQSRLN